MRRLRIGIGRMSEIGTPPSYLRHVVVPWFLGAYSSQITSVLSLLLRPRVAWMTVSLKTIYQDARRRSDFRTERTSDGEARRSSPYTDCQREQMSLESPYLLHLTPHRSRLPPRHSLAPSPPRPSQQTTKVEIRALYMSPSFDIPLGPDGLDYGWRGILL